MLMVEGSTAGSDLHWTTEPALNQLYGTRLRPADVSVRRCGPPAHSVSVGFGWFRFGLRLCDYTFFLCPALGTGKQYEQESLLGCEGMLCRGIWTAARS